MRASRYGIVVMFALVMSVGCSSDPRNNDAVRYSGASLRVDGNDYPRETTPSRVAKGRVLVTPKQGEQDAVTSLLARYGLSLAGTTARGVLVVIVPEGFELQWSSAFSNASSVTFATTDDVGMPAALASVPAAPPKPAPVAKGKPVPEGGPPLSVVRKLTYEMYEDFESKGGVPLTLTATGKSAVVHMELADVTVESCRVRRADVGEFECGVLLKVRSCLGDCNPSREEALDDAKRMIVRWDPSGKWVYH
ncbi:hypothetical protein ACQQ2N_18055 [Dokdonella sp. MW10]|uniref:hypothetical protein n=1 Tax=Dokdonella sp. MW10 TaxID=2992926 RepID=UPI003F8131C2